MGATDNFPITAPQGLVYGMEENVLSGVLESIADSGRVFGRRKRADQRAWRATYRLTTEQLRQLRDFYNRFRGASQYFIWTRPGWFTNSGALSDRVFAVHWAAAPAVVAQHHENYDVEISLIEAVGVSLASYPDPAAGHPSHFQEETAGFVAGGVWTQASHSNAHGGAEKTNPNTNTTDRFRFMYSGYGFRLWARKASDLGIVEVLLDGASLGTLDLYSASALASAAGLTKLDVPLGLHIVELKATNTKNASSSANTIVADAVEVIP